LDWCRQKGSGSVRFQGVQASTSVGSRETSTSSPVTLLHRRSPFVRALCVLNIDALSTIAFRTGALHSTRMNISSTTVPSIVVYVIVPNKEAGKKLSESIVKEKLTACVKLKSVPAKPTKPKASMKPRGKCYKMCGFTIQGQGRC
jgi:hypothetical protein